MISAIHIGLHKTGSTYLQKVALPGHPEIHPISWGNSPEFRDDLHNLTTGILDPVKIIQPSIAQKVERLAQEHKGKKLILSFETLSGKMFSGENRHYIARSLDQAIPGEPNIILVLRNQYDYLKSAWCHYIREGGTHPVRTFLTEASSPATLETPGITDDRCHGLYHKFDYYHYVRMLQDLFGKERLHVLFYEDIRQNFSSFTSSLYRACQVDPEVLPENKRTLPSGYKVNVRQAKLLRYLNTLCLTRHNRPLCPLPKLTTYSRPRLALISLINRLGGDEQYDMKPHLPAHVVSAIKESNRNLSDLLGRDLNELGYDL